MGVGLGGRGIEDHGALEDNGVHEEASGNNHGTCSRETNIRILYRHREDGGLQ